MHCPRARRWACKSCMEVAGDALCGGAVTLTGATLRGGVFVRAPPRLQEPLFVEASWRLVVEFRLVLSSPAGRSSLPGLSGQPLGMGLHMLTQPARAAGALRAAPLAAAALHGVPDGAGLLVAVALRAARVATPVFMGAPAWADLFFRPRLFAELSTIAQFVIRAAPLAAAPLQKPLPDVLRL